MRPSVYLNKGQTATPPLILGAKEKVSLESRLPVNLIAIVTAQQLILRGLDLKYPVADSKSMLFKSVSSEIAFHACELISLTVTACTKPPVQKVCTCT